jgi:hypothetical protein
MTGDHWAERKRDRGPERMVTGPARDALIDQFAGRYPEPQNDRVRLKVSDPDSGRASTFRLRGADAKNLDTLMRTFGMTTEAVPDRAPGKRGRSR